MERMTRFNDSYRSTYRHTSAQAFLALGPCTLRQDALIIRRALNGLAQSRQDHACATQVDADAIQKEINLQGTNGHEVAPTDCVLQGNTAGGSCNLLIMAAIFCNTISLRSHCNGTGAISTVCNLSSQTLCISKFNACGKKKIQRRFRSMRIGSVAIDYKS